MRERDLKDWTRLVEERSAAEGHTLSDEVTTELAMFISERSTFQSGETGGWTGLNVAKISVMQATIDRIGGLFG